jgi:superfamily I DNA/RNA helicase
MGLRLVKEAGLNPKVNFKKFKNSLGPLGKVLDTLLIKGGKCTSKDIRNATNNVNTNMHILTKYSDEKLIKKFRKVLRNTKYISGNEMLWWPISMSLTTQKEYPILLIDEAVDMNVLQLEFIRRIRTKKIVFMYDQWQNIYGFNGAVPNLVTPWLDHYKPKYMSLPQSFRCPEKIIMEVDHLHTGIQSAKPGGIVYTTDIEHLTIPDECLIISRFNADLLTAANILLKKGKKFSVKKRALLKIIGLLKRLQKDDSNINNIKNHLVNDLIFKQERNIYNMSLYATEAFNIAEGALQLIQMGNSNWDDINIICNLMLQMSEEDHSIKLATIHAAKGLEHKHVILMGYNRMQNLLISDNVNVEQERNLLYVAVTRSKQTLTYVEV